MRQHFPELVGLCFAGAVLLMLFAAAQGGAALLFAIGLGTAGVVGSIHARRRRQRRRA